MATESAAGDFSRSMIVDQIEEYIKSGSGKFAKNRGLLNPIKNYKSSSKRKVPKKPDYHERQRSKEDFAIQSRLYSNIALKYFNNKVGPECNYELVETGLGQGGATISKGPITHINFKAKDKCNPKGKVRTFFAQLRSPSSGTVVDCCEPLGLGDDLPDGLDNHGCQYCGKNVLHPIGGCKKLLTGRVNDDAYWLYGHDAMDDDPDT